MLNRRHRFHGYGSVRRVYKASQSLYGPMLGLRYSRRKAGAPYRVTVVIGRKVHKSAVRRNRIRRRVYETVRLSKNVPDSTDLVFSVYSDELADLPSDKLAKLIEDLLIQTKSNQPDSNR